MSRLYVYCEGPSEREFVSRILHPYLYKHGIIAIPIVCATGEKYGKIYKGGVSDYSKICKELKKICYEHRNEHVTTMIDFYGLPSNTPGIESNDIDDVKKSITKDIGANNLLIYLSRHEYEALLFSDVDSFREKYGDDIVHDLRKIRLAYDTPEDINNSRDTAPSKRIQQLIPEYKKVIDGTTIALYIGIEKMMAECPYFKAWVESIICFCKE